MTPTYRAIVGAVCVIASTPAMGGEYFWTNIDAAASNWNIGTQWTPTGFPNAVGDVVNVTNNFTGVQTIHLNQSTVTIGVLNLGDAGGTAYSIIIITNNATPGTLGTLTVGYGESAT